MKKVVELDGFEYIMEEDEKVIGIIQENESGYSITLRPKTRVTNAFKKG